MRVWTRSAGDEVRERTEKSCTLTLKIDLGLFGGAILSSVLEVKQRPHSASESDKVRSMVASVGFQETECNGAGTGTGAAADPCMTASLDKSFAIQLNAIFDTFEDPTLSLEP